MADPNSPVTRFTIWRASLPPAIRLLLTINIVTYVVFVFLSIFGQGDLMFWLALPMEPARLLIQPWSVVTHAFANAYPSFFGLIAIGFGLLWLNWIGRDLEEVYGSHQILGVYVLSALGATATAMAFLSTWEGALIPVYGLWSAVGAIIVYAAVMNPDRGIGMMFIGVISMKWIAIAFIVLDLAFSTMSLRAAHVGAYLVGALFGVMQKRGIELGAWARPFFGSRRRQRPSAQPSYGSASGGWSPRRDVATRTRSASSPRRTATASRSVEPTQADIDRILEKIHEKGMDSLSKDEKRVLEKWSGQS